MLVPLVASFLLAGCGHEPTRPLFHVRTPVFGERDSVFTDQQVFDAIYSNYAHPPGFYEDPSDESVYYPNTGSIVDSRQRPADPWVDLSTEDPAQARAWADSTAAHSSEPEHIAATPPTATERYFEFQDVYDTGRPKMKMRVHRSSYVSDVQKMNTFFVTSGVAGTYHVRPVAAENVRGLVEYLWVQAGGGYGEKALSSFTTDAGPEVAHTLYTVAYEHGDYGIQDVLHLRRTEYRVDKSTGVIRWVAAEIRQVRGRQN